MAVSARRVGGADGGQGSGGERISSGSAGGQQWGNQRVFFYSAEWQPFWNGRKEKVFYLMMHSKHLDMVIWKEGSVLFNNTLNTFRYGYMEGRKCFI